MSMPSLDSRRTPRSPVGSRLIEAGLACSQVASGNQGGLNGSDKIQLH